MAGSAVPASGNPVPTTIEVDSTPPAFTHGGIGQSWVVEGEGFTAAYTRFDEPAAVEVGACGRDYLVFVADVEGEVTLREGDHEVVVTEPTIVVAAGSRLRVECSARTEVVWALPGNCAAALGGRDVAASPASIHRPALVAHPISAVPSDPTRFGRIFTSRTVMMNVLDIPEGPRDIEALSPHSHSDFAQCTVTLAGRFVHDLRVPWGPRLEDWVEDEHRPCDSPSLTMIPATVVHTLRWDDGPHVAVDIFGPPRKDFLNTPGWVLNASDFPRLRD